MSAPIGDAVLRRYASAAALGGLVQAVAAVHATAHGRSLEPAVEGALLRSIFVTDPDSIDDVFPSLTPYREGLQLAGRMLTAPGGAPAEALKYCVVLLEIERQLARRPSVGKRLGEGLAGIVEPDWQSDIPTTVYRELSEVYQQSISTLDRRVQVTGDAQQLRLDEVAARVRALLLAGVRFAWLWRQLGGRRWHLVMRRSTIRSALAALDEQAAAVSLH